MKRTPKAGLEPVSISDLDWFYSGRRRFTFVHQVWVDGEFLRTDQTEVKTADLVEALRRLGLVEKKGTPAERRVTPRNDVRRAARR